jgi:TPR repeat protein
MARQQATRRIFTTRRKPAITRNPLLWIAFGVIALIGLMLLSSERQSPLSGSGPARSTAAVDPARQTDRPQAGKPGEEARLLIAEVRKPGQKPDLDALLIRGDEFARQGRLTDAYLLYLFAAREGSARAAFTLGSLSDPNHHSPERSLLDKPDPVQAFKWYRLAADKGHIQAKDRLRKLQQWVEARARAGDRQAQQLMLSWR